MRNGDELFKKLTISISILKVLFIWKYAFGRVNHEYIKLGSLKIKLSLTLSSSGLYIAHATNIGK